MSETKELQREEITSDVIRLHSKGLLESLYMAGNTPENCAVYSNLLERARELDTINSNHELEALVIKFSQTIAEEFQMPVLWELPEEFKKHEIECKFPVDALPDVLKNYLLGVSESLAVSPEMCVLPMFSVLAFCLQCKVLIKHPSKDYTKKLNLYTLTLGASGTGKSPAFDKFSAPIFEHIKSFNNSNKLKIEQYINQKQYLEAQRETAKKKPGNEERINELTQKLHELVPVRPMPAPLSDTTSEALVEELVENSEKAAILDDEGSVFDIMTGLYTNGKTNLNIYLKGYDSSPTSVNRKGRKIQLASPTITMGVLTQPEQFYSRIITNQEFIGRGLLQRFLISAPTDKSETETPFTTNPIPYDAEQAYIALIKKLLDIPCPALMPIISHSSESYNRIKEHHSAIEKIKVTGIKNGIDAGFFSKQIDKCLKIAGILHMCEHSASEKINGETADRACLISNWAVNELFATLGNEYNETPLEHNSKYIIKRIKDRKITGYITKNKLIHECRSIRNANDFDNALALLEEKKYVRIEEIKTGGRPSIRIHINPCI